MKKGIKKMKSKYTIPLYNMSGGNNKQTIKTAIKFLEDHYCVNHDFMGDNEKIEMLQCINDLYHIYFSMKQAEVKQC